MCLGEGVAGAAHRDDRDDVVVAGFRASRSGDVRCVIPAQKSSP